MSQPDKTRPGVEAIVGIVSAALEGGAGGPQPDGDGPGPSDQCDELGPSDAETSGADPRIVAECAKLDHSDTDNGARLRAHFGRDLCVMAQGGAAGGDWLAWDGRFWDLDGGLAAASLLAQRVGGRIALEAAHLDLTPAEKEAVGRALGYADSDDSEPAKQARALAELARKVLKGRQAARWRFAVTSKNAGRMASMLSAAAPHLRRDADDFNADGMLVVTKTHTLRFVRERDLECPDPGVDRWAARLEALPGHRREDYATGLVPCAYAPDAPNGKWLRFLDRTMPDPDKRRTLQQYAGMSLLGVLPQKLMFHYGLGANGKSVFLAVLSEVLGKTYAVRLPSESIIGDQARGVGQASPDLVRMFGKRCVIIDELPEGKQLHEDLVKRLTGGDEIAVRNLFKGYFEFRNVATPHMSGNGFPKIAGTDNGIWRRMLVLHWSVTIPPEEQRDFGEFVADLMTEAPGILNWLIAGALDYLANGLVVAAPIAAATQAYREDMDPIGRFVADCVEAAPAERVGARVMFEAYRSWCAANAVTPSFETKFGREMSKRFERRKSGTQVYLDCRLHDVPARPDAPPPSPDYGDYS